MSDPTDLPQGQPAPAGPAPDRTPPTGPPPHAPRSADPRGEPPPADGPEEEVPCAEVPADDAPAGPPRLQHPARGRRCLRKDPAPASPLTPQQRLLLLDAWRRSGLPAGDFAPLAGISQHTPYAWHRKFQEEEPAGLEDRPRGGPTGSR